MAQGVHIYNADSISLYKRWKSPMVIISDGPYGISGFKGDLNTPVGLGSWYEPHIKMWSEFATHQTTLWFWNTEIGWATVHPILEKYGWEFKTCNVWNKGMSHVAGNTNTKTISHLPVVTEVCVQYVKRPSFLWKGGVVTMKEWLRLEWERTGLPFSKTNEACEVVDAATRKYFTKCHLWYMPPSEMFGKIVAYANKNGDPAGKPYFSIDGINPLTVEDWSKMKAKFYCPIGITNVWQSNQLRGRERIKNGLKAVHLNQKPLSIIRSLIEMASDEGDVVWDPFGGLFTTAVACMELNRICYTSEINPAIYKTAEERLRLHEVQQPLQFAFEQ